MVRDRIVVFVGSLMLVALAGACSSPEAGGPAPGTASVASTGTGGGSGGEGGAGSSCSDGVANAGESDVDCGGPCPGCPQGSGCDDDADCASGSCIDATGTCGIVSGEPLWAKSYGGAADGDFAYSVAVDSAGNAYVTGSVSGPVDPGGGPVTTLGRDIFVVKLDPDGGHVWSHAYGGDTDLDYGFGITVTPAGTVYVTGQFQGSVDFGGGPLTSTGEHDAFVLKLDAAGGHLWSKALSGPGYDYGYSVAVAADESVYVSGLFLGPFEVGGAAPLVSTGSAYDAFILKLDPAGTHVFSHAFGGPSHDYGSSITVGPDDTVYAAGYFQESITFGATTLVTSGAAVGDTDAYVARFDGATGEALWAKDYGDVEYDYGYTVAYDAADDALYAAGYFTKTIDFGGEPLVSAGDHDIFLTKLGAASGDRVWSHRFGGPGTDRGYAVAFDGVGNVYLTGFFTGSVDFGGGALQSAGPIDMFVAAFDADGVHQWSERYGGAGSEEAISIDVNEHGDLYIAGALSGTVTMGAFTLVSEGARDAFVAKVGENPPAGPK